LVGHVDADELVELLVDAVGVEDDGHVLEGLGLDLALGGDEGEDLPMIKKPCCRRCSARPASRS